MGGIKRFGLIVFGIAGILCLCGLALPWVGPYQREAASLMQNWYYYNVMQALVAITGIGSVISLLRGLFMSPGRKSVVIDREGDDQITVTTAAISSQATHVIEEDGTVGVERVRVSTDRKGGVQIDVRVRPQHPVDVADEGRHLHDALQWGLRPICGDRIQRINLEFLEAVRAGDDDLLEEPGELDGPREFVIPPSAYDRKTPVEAPTEATVPPVDTDASTAASEGESSSYETEGEVR